MGGKKYAYQATCSHALNTKSGAQNNQQIGIFEHWFSGRVWWERRGIKWLGAEKLLPCSLFCICIIFVFVFEISICICIFLSVLWVTVVGEAKALIG